MRSWIGAVRWKGSMGVDVVMGGGRVEVVM